MCAGVRATRLQAEVCNVTPRGPRGLLLPKSGQVMPAHQSANVKREVDQVERNLKGKELEKAGKTDDAINLYEQNVRERAIGTHSYDRLAIIYRRRKRFAEEIRVLEVATSVYESDVSPENRSRERNLAKFRTRLEKARSKDYGSTKVSSPSKTSRPRLRSITQTDSPLVLIAFDVETTGLLPDESEIIEVAGIKFTVDGERLSEFAELARPEGPIPKEVTRITGITDAMVADAPKPYSAIRRFTEWAGSEAVLVAHNAPFDSKFLVHCFRKNGATPPAWRVVDTLEWARRASLPVEDHKLGTLARHLRIPSEASHRAKADSEVAMALTLHFLSRLKNRKRGITSRATSLVDMAKDPASRRQLSYLRNLGASELELEDLDRQQASRLIDRYKARSEAAGIGKDEERSGCLSRRRSRGSCGARPRGRRRRADRHMHRHTAEMRTVEGVRARP